MNKLKIGSSRRKDNKKQIKCFKSKRDNQKIKRDVQILKEKSIKFMLEKNFYFPSTFHMKMILSFITLI